jgi:hypothetical protein
VFERLHEILLDELGEAGQLDWSRVQPRWSGGLPDNLVRIRELIAGTPQAEGAPWRLVLDLDLAGTVQIANRPLDEPLRWWLADPRQLRTTRVTDGLWVRPLDLRALASRADYRELHERPWTPRPGSFRPLER